MIVWLNKGDIAMATTLAGMSQAKYAQINGHYENTPAIHLVGKIGEVGITKLLAKYTVCECPALELDDSKADIIAGRYRVKVEVKTWRSDTFAKYGRAITCEQLPRLEKKAEMVIWTTYTPFLEYGIVRAVGWNYIRLVGLYEPRPFTQPNGNVVMNHQVPMDGVEDMKHLVGKYGKLL